MVYYESLGPNKKSGSRVGSDNLEWPWKAEHEGQMFPVDLCNNDRTVGYNDHFAWGMASMGSATPPY